MHYLMTPFKKGLLLFLVLLFALTSCKSKPSYLIDEDTFAAILADLMVIEKLPVSKAERLKRTQAVFEKHGVSPEAFTKTKLYYKRDVDFWQRIYKKTMKQLEKTAKERHKKIHPLPPEQNKPQPQKPSARISA